MNPRSQIQEQAKIAADKVRAAMSEFSRNTGMRAEVYVEWIEFSIINGVTPNPMVIGVNLEIRDGDDTLNEGWVL